MSGLGLLKSTIRTVCSQRLQARLRLLYVARQVVNSHSFHEPEMNILKALVHPGDHVADVGANVGAYTLELSRLVGSEGQVYAFEPITNNFDILQRVIHKAGLSNVQTFYAALGAEAGVCEMVIPDSDAFTGFYLAHRAEPGDTGQRKNVNVLTFNDLWKTKVVDRLDFIKCDVEGGELAVIRGSAELIKNQRPGWLMEVSRDTSSEVFHFFHEFGYVAFVYDHKLVQTQDYRDKEFSNYFFFHPGRSSYQV
jgi:FkbM family methyltransferase